MTNPATEAELAQAYQQGYADGWKATRGETMNKATESHATYGDRVNVAGRLGTVRGISADSTGRHVKGYYIRFDGETDNVYWPATGNILRVKVQS